MRTATATINQIVKPMERGQITIPANIRKKLKITPQTWLWVKLIEEKILIEPVEKPVTSSIGDYIHKVASDRKVYWERQDELGLEKVRKKSLQRLQKFL